MKGTIAQGVYLKKEDEANKLKMAGGAWSINLNYIKDKDIKAVEYVTDKFIYLITLQEAFKKGFERTLGGEPKLVVPIKHWKVITKLKRINKAKEQYYAR